jgi:hypothetical protein
LIAPGILFCQFLKEGSHVMKWSTPRSASPFDDSAVERHRHMGLIGADGTMDIAAVTILAHVHAGLFFDALCDSCAAYETVTTICGALIELAQTFPPKRVLLALCTEYDAMRRPLPDAIWWISGSVELVPPFMEQFLQWLDKLRIETEVI